MLNQMKSNVQKNCHQNTEKYLTVEKIPDIRIYRGVHLQRNCLYLTEIQNYMEMNA